MIDRNTIINSIPYPIRSFFEIESMEFEDNEQYQTAIKAFITAVDIINSHCHINKKVVLIFGSRQMQVDIDGIPFSYYIPQPALHLHIRNFIYLNVVESSTLSYESQVGAYLEELVHAFMNARNEELTHKIVELLYPCVKHSAEYGFVRR